MRYCGFSLAVSRRCHVLLIEWLLASRCQYWLGWLVILSTHSAHLYRLRMLICIPLSLGCQAGQSSLDGRFKWVFGMVSFATLLIFIRCVYRIYELSDGYHGAALHDEGLFIGLESIMIILATFILNLGHPGMAFSLKYKQAYAVDFTA
ncbi:hypothetical protein D6C98_10672, partial [Aureobasidium pullulans]